MRFCTVNVAFTFRVHSLNLFRFKLLVPTGNITFHRQVINKEDFPKWEKSSASLTKLHVSSKGNIEDDGMGMLQVIHFCPCLYFLRCNDMYIK